MPYSHLDLGDALIEFTTSILEELEWSENLKTSANLITGF
jgi:hypothetical protein